ncbi:RDD family protein [Microbacterium suaedae]|uniref:RDD family protein n=1 Tax=Microbacterium suaedae TaxID=2067813 RepID=UPI000DA25E94|nr:RDD family protein [Microbacterium suaedae]
MSTGQSSDAGAPYGGVPPAAQHPPHVEAPQPASLGTRVGVYLIDMVLVGVAAGILIGPISVVLAAVSAPMLARGEALGYVPLVLVPLLIATALIVVYVAMQGSGGSFAQRWLKVRLVRAGTGAKLGFWRALARHLIWALSTVIVVGYFSVFFDRSGRRQGWHDKATDTLVVDISGSRAASAVAPQGWQPDPRLNGAPAAAAPASPYAAPSAPAAAPQSPAGYGTPQAQYAPPAAPPVPPRPADPPAPADPSPAPASPRGGIAASDPAPADPFATPAAPQDAFAAPDPAQPAAADPFATPDAPRDAFAETDPAQQAPVDEGPIAFVPGVTGERPPAPPRASEPEPLEQPSAPPASETIAQPPADDFPDDTVVINRSSRQAPVSVVLAWDDGRHTTSTSRTVFGRNPLAEDGADHVAIEDDSRSLSKTHFEISVDGEGATVTDRHSTNGVVLERDGVPTELVPGVPTALAVGDVLAIGDRRATVERAGRS